MEIVRGKDLELTATLTSRGTSLEKVDPPKGSKYLAVQMPSYLPNGEGSRKLHPGDDRVNGEPPLTNFISPAEVFIRIVPKDTAPGGWYINSSWPQ